MCVYIYIYVYVCVCVRVNPDAAAADTHEQASLAFTRSCYYQYHIWLTRTG